MKTKLTLKIDQELIAFGKHWAKHQGKSLSSLIEEYLAAVKKLSPSPTPPEPANHELRGFVIGSDEDEYLFYLEKKCQS